VHPSLPFSLLQKIFYHGKHTVDPDMQTSLLLIIEKKFYSLEPLQQNLLLLRYRDDLSQQAIAERLHIPLSSVRRQQARTLHTLRLVGNPEYATLLQRLQTAID
jgi:DNA-directed RNA polymerase specialized sigma24 family protein